MKDPHAGPLLRPGPGAAHAYGPNLLLHAYPYPLSLLSRLGSPEVTQPEAGRLASRLYELLFAQVASLELETELVSLPTRMTASHPDQLWEGTRVRRHQRVVVADVARAGILGAQLFYERLNELLEPADVRQDHLFVSRRTDPAGRVVGSEIRSAKVGGPVTGAVLMVPDPMGATGGSLCEVLDYYERSGAGVPERVVFVHLIVTPEYVRRIHTRLPEARIHAVRLDRGNSSPQALAALPGTHPEAESGLDSHQYVVPGAGGLGEVLNNAWV